jgi:hypothetical protein
MKTPTRRRLPACLAIAAALFALATNAGAKSEQWKNAKGETFSASPSDIIGPWALFDDGTLLPLSLLSNEDSVRFYEGLKDVPPRAADWKDAKSKVSSEVYGRLLHYSGNDIVKDDEAGRPEPEFYILFYVTNDENQSWNMLQRSTPELYAKMLKDHGDLVQGIVYGDGLTFVIQDLFDIAVHTHGDWLFADFGSEVLMRTVANMIPSNFYGIVVVTRDGVPLFGPDAATDDQVKDTFAKLTGLLDHMNPNDPKVWIARYHYFNVVQPVAFANGHSDPKLIGNPLIASTLRKMKIYKIDATFHVAADGKITSVDVTPYDMPPKTVNMFTNGFQRGCVFVPAVDHGKFVDGTYAYHMEIKP